MRLVGATRRTDTDKAESQILAIPENLARTDATNATDTTDQQKETPSYTDASCI